MKDVVRLANIQSPAVRSLVVVVLEWQRMVRLFHLKVAWSASHLSLGFDGVYVTKLEFKSKELTKLLLKNRRNHLRNFLPSS